MTKIKLNFVENNILAHLVTELNHQLADAKLKSVQSLAWPGLVFSLQTSAGATNLVISLHPTYPAVYATAGSVPTNPAQNNPFESHLKGARLQRIEQVNGDRLIQINWQIHNPVFGPTILTMVGEFFSAFSNLVLVDQEKKILAFAKSQGIGEEKGRLIARGAEYQPLAAPESPGFFQCGESDFYQAWTKAQPGLPVWKLFVQNFAHLSPQIAQEIVHRATIDPQLPISQLEPTQQAALWSAFQEIRKLCQKREQPEFYFYFNAETQQLSGISLFPSVLFPLSTPRLYSQLNQTLAEILPQLIIQAEFMTQKGKLERELIRQVNKASALRKQLQADLERANTADQWRLWGELIKANSRNLRPGLKEVSVTNFYDPENATITIPLDPKMKLHANADRYFRLARKADDSQNIVQKRMKQNNSDLMRLYRWQEQLTACTQLDELNEWQKQITGSPAKRDQKSALQASKVKKVRFREFLIGDGWRVLVGRNNAENDELTLRTAALDDLWFHVQDARGSHVVLRREGRKQDISPQALEQAAGIAAWFSKARHSSKAPVDFTEIRYVRKPKGSPPGLVTISQGKSIMVKPCLPAKPLSPS